MFHWEAVCHRGKDGLLATVRLESESWLYNFECIIECLPTPELVILRKFSHFSFLPSFLPSLLLFRATPMAYGSSQARSWIRTTVASLHHSHSNAGSLAHWARPGIQPASSWILVWIRFCCATVGTPKFSHFSNEYTESEWSRAACLRSHR